MRDYNGINVLKTLRDYNRVNVLKTLKDYNRINILKIRRDYDRINILKTLRDYNILSQYLSCTESLYLTQIGLFLLPRRAYDISEGAMKKCGYWEERLWNRPQENYII
jgi:hypothetical protein